MDCPCPCGIHDVLRLYVCRCDVTTPVAHRERARMESRCIRHLCCRRVYPQRVWIPHCCRSHPRQMRYPLHRRALCLNDVHWSMYQILCHQRCFCRFCLLHMARLMVDIHARLCQVGILRIHDLRMRLRDGRNNGFQSHCQVV